jgi:hypothetical protein
VRAALALLLALLPLCAAAQTYKCKDKSGGITYSSETCEKQGLKDAGPVRERLTTMPQQPLPTVKRSPNRDAEKKKDPERAEGTK